MGMILVIISQISNPGNPMAPENRIVAGIGVLLFIGYFIIEFKKFKESKENWKTFCFGKNKRSEKLGEQENE